MTKAHIGQSAGRAAEVTDWASAITVTSERRVYVRGLALDEAIGAVSMPTMILRLWRGDAPGEDEASLLGACIVAAIDHGPLAPSAIVARTIASTRATPISALAGGLLSFGELHGAVVTRAMTLLAAVPLAGSVQTWAEETFRTEREAGRRLPGIGHRWHSTDERAERLLDVAEPLANDRHVLAIRALADRVARHAGRPVAVNIDGALAVALGALRLDPAFGDLLFAIARSFGLAAHIVEERVRERPMRLIDPTAATYDGVSVAEQADMATS
jgi:citrate synthase